MNHAKKTLEKGENLQGNMPCRSHDPAPLREEKREAITSPVFKRGDSQKSS